MDRRFPAIVAIGLITSTVISYFVIADVPNESITVIRNSAPDAIRRQVDLELTQTFSLGMITRKSIQELAIQYLFFTPVDELPPLTSVGWDERIPYLREGRGLLADLGYQPDLIHGTFELENRQTEFLLYDYGRFFPIFTYWRLAEDATTSHLIIPHGDENASQYVGRSGFYQVRGELARVIVSRGEDQTIFTAQRSAQQLQAGERRIDEAPHNGRIVFNDLAPDESISIIVEVMGRADQRYGSLSIILIQVDGVLVEKLFNFIN